MKKSKTRPADLLHSGFAIFPCSGKVPLTEHGVNDATKSFDEVFAWIRLSPNCNWGIACGEQSGITVVDVDTSDVPISQTLRDLYKLGVPDGNVVRTPSGGLHLYTRHRAGLSNKVRLLGKPVDIRTTGGYVIGVGPGYDRITWNNKFEECPEWIVEACRPKPIVHRDVVLSKNPQIMARLMREASEGERNHKLFKLACWAVRDGGDLNSLQQAALDVGLPHYEVERTINSARRKAMEAA